MFKLKLQTLSEQIESLREYSANPAQRIRTGWGPLDQLVGGPAPGEVFMILGRSYSGKSIVAQNIIVNNKQHASILFSLEMPTPQAVGRMYSMWSGTPNKEFQAMVEEGRIPQHIDDMEQDFPLHRIVDDAALSLGGMSEYLQAFYDSYGTRPEFVVIDYLELIGGAKKSGEGWIGTEVTAASLKDWAKNEEMRVFVVHQTNLREEPWKPPTETSARGAGYTEADYVIGIWQPGRDPDLDYMDYQSLKGKLSVNVLKNRAFGDSWSGREIEFQLFDDLSLKALENF